jgi:hypothetical protein
MARLAAMEERLATMEKSGSGSGSDVTKPKAIAPPFTSATSVLECDPYAVVTVQCRRVPVRVAQSFHGCSDHVNQLKHVISVV